MKKNHCVVLPVSFAALSLLYACGTSETKPASMPPPNGELCFVADNVDYGSQYLFVTINNGAIEGSGTHEGDFSTTFDWHSTFKGKFGNDSTALVHARFAASDEKPPETETWHFDFRNGHLKTISASGDSMFYHTDNGATLKKEIAARKAFNESEGTFYESSPADANKHTTLREFIKVTIKGNSVQGVGAGEAEGSPYWVFSFHGALVHDTLLDVGVTYREDESSLFTTAELWVLDRRTKRLYRRQGIPEAMGSYDHATIKGENVPAFFARRMLAIGHGSE